MSEKIHQVAIIGSGPAGYTAAIYAARANLEPILVDGMQPGGQLTITTEVENYPGFPEGMQGPELMDLFRKQAERFGTQFVMGQVSKVDFESRPFTLEVDGGEDIKANSVIIATGASARWLGIESEKALMGHGVSACATCDGFFFKDVPVVVVGGGDTALEEASFLSRFASKVSIIHRRDELRGSKIMQKRAFDNPKIEFVWDSVVEEILGSKEDGVTGVTVKNVKTGETSKIDCEGYFVAIGHKPNTEIFKGQIDLHENGYIVLAEPGTSKTSREGIFVAGDAADQHYRQAITAAGTGCMAALDAERYLLTLED
ncbi:MAG: thioredoxin-disulfide reductase [Deltaproteobacteria bacterium]|nr:thioredoxin-disulfide reductase [Deltaproteobacteria bacterium]